MKSSYSLRNNPTCIDLFSGAGGLSLGFAQAGGLPVAAIDLDQLSIDTYRRMFPMCNSAIAGPIEDWQPPKNLKNVDVVIGGPPCQGFSLARGTRFVEDPRNRLYKEFIRIVKETRPRWVVMENVQGITNIGEGIVLKQILEDFEDIGFRIEYKIINTAEFGIPQTRKRAIFVGTREKHGKISWPTPKFISRPKKADQLTLNANYYYSVSDALGDLPWPEGKYIAHRANSQMRGPRNRNVLTDPSFTVRTRADEFGLRNDLAQGPFAPAVAENLELKVLKPSNAYQAFMQNDLPPWKTEYRGPIFSSGKRTKLLEPRRLSIRELARLQSFPDWFNFQGSPYQQGRQIGNAVPPLFAKLLFERLLNT